MNGSLENVALRKFLLDLKISKAFAMSLEVSFLYVFAYQSLVFFFFAEVRCLFGFVMHLFGFQESSFSGFKGTSSQTLWAIGTVQHNLHFKITFTLPSVNAALT